MYISWSVTVGFSVWRQLYVLLTWMTRLDFKIKPIQVCLTKFCLTKYKGCARLIITACKEQNISCAVSLEDKSQRYLFLFWWLFGLNKRKNKVTDKPNKDCTARKKIKINYEKKTTKHANLIFPPKMTPPLFLAYLIKQFCLRHKQHRDRGIEQNCGRKKGWDLSTEIGE